MSTNVGNTTFTPNTPFNVTLANGSNIVGLIIANKSGYEFLVTPENCDAKTLYPGTADFFATTRAWSGIVFFIPTGQTLPNVQNYPARQISFEAVYRNERLDPTSYPMSLAAIQAVSPTASGKALFSATFGIGVSAGARQAVNVFNPANSGVTMTFHSARAITNETTIPTASLVFQAGADLNLPIAASAVSHDGNANPRVSVAHVTARDDNVVLGGTAIETLQMAGSVLVDALLFPDQVTLAPGNNLFMGIVSSTNGHNVRITMKWSEDQAPAPAFVAVGAGQQAIATSLVNDGQPVGTQVIEFRPSGQAGSAWFVTNDGLATLQALISGVYHAILKASSSGNPLQLGQVGDIAEFLGSAQIDNELNFNTAGTTVNNTGGTGTATLWQFLGGIFKVVLLEEDNFKNVTSTIDIALPVAFANFAIILTSDIASINTVLAGVIKNVNVLTGVAGTGNTVTNQATATANGFSYTPQGFDTIRLTSGNASAHNGIAIILGR